MSKIKKVSVIALIIALIASGCNAPEKAGTAHGDKIKITATVFPLYDFARQIVKDRAELVMLLPTGAEVHSYEPTPKDIIQIQSSDLFIRIGGAVDSWSESATAEENGKEVNTISATDCCTLLTEDEHEHENSAHTAKETEIDEHVWTSPKNAMLIAQKICDEICELDKENEEIYRENSAQFQKQLQELDVLFESTVKNGADVPVVFADRFPFKYLANDYGFSYIAAFLGCSSESEPSAHTVTKIIDSIKEQKIGVVMYTETSNGELADTICEETGAKKMLMHSCHTVTKKQFAENITYVELMKSNVNSLKAALSAKDT